MGKMIKGKTITLHEMTQTGLDPFGNPEFASTTVNVDNVLIEPASADAVVAELQLNGKHLAYILHIPKGDTHTWTDTKVEFYGKTFNTYGGVMEYDEDMTPLDWNKKVKVEAYE